MSITFRTQQVTRPLRWLLPTLISTLFSWAALAQDDSLPPRSQWRASSSSVEVPAMASALAIDGDTKTRWGGGFSANHWLQIDLGRVATIGGALVQWDTGFAASYVIQSSTDGKQWSNAYETNDSQGVLDYIFFPAVKARYLRLASVPRTADWGVSVFEFEPLSVPQSPRVTGLAGAGDTATVWSPGQRRELSTAGSARNTRELRIALPRPFSVAGLDVTWGAARSNAKLEARDAAGKWTTLADDPESLGTNSYLAARQAVTASELRLTVQAAAGTPAISRLRLLSSVRVMTPMKRYEITASRANRDLFPASLHAEQVYWTAVGVPAGRQKTVFDEYGNVEAFKGAPLVQPLWRDSSGKAASTEGRQRTHSLHDGWMPMPTVEWSPQAGLQLRSDAIAIEQSGAPVTLVRYRLQNTGKAKIDGQLALIVRPMQVNPPWQNGGPSPIHDIAIEGAATQSAVRVNGRILLQSLTPIDTRGASPFGSHGEQEITRHVPAGTVPSSLTAHDDDGLAAALLNYRVQLDPGALRDIVLAFPLGNERFDATATKLPDAPAIDRAALVGSSGDASKGFDTLTTQVAQQWQARLGRIGLSLPDRSLVDMLRAQAAYMLVNQTGPVMQAGPRNYNRSFIRDGSATAAILLRMGMAKTARDYLKWYSDHAVHENGLVSPILNEDGTVNTGFGSDLEHDSQGEFIWLVAEVARLDGGASSVRDYQAKVKLAMKFMQELRERTLVPGYMADRPAPERFRGIIAPSISHEGYSVPTHSYWDDYWALKGWHDGAWLADSWGDKETATWARQQYAALRDSMAASIRATMQWKGADFIPAAADLGDGDPTSVSIAIDPCGQLDLLPADALERTFARYLDDVRKREAPDALYAYTPYELRNVLTYVHLNKPQEADELLQNFVRHRRPAPWQVLAEVIHSRLRHPGYLGDMPHTWIGSEYARSIFGMLMREADDRLMLLPGTPPSWLAGDGLTVSELPTAYGTLSMSARQQGNTLRLTLAPGIRDQSAMEIAWPSRTRPTSVTVDGRKLTSYTADGVKLDRPFKELVAQW